MVGPSMTDEERRAAGLRLKVGFVALVGASAGLVALQVDSSLPQLAAAVAGGVAVGAVLIWYLTRLGGQFGR